MPERRDKYPKGLTAFMDPNCAAALQMKEIVKRAKASPKNKVKMGGLKYGYDYRPEDDTYPDEG